MALPQHYQWLKTIDAPKVIKEALALYDTTETPGPASNPVIIAWAEEVGIKDLYKTDSVAWCALFAAVILKRAGKDLYPITGWDLLRARKFELFGNKVKAPALGDVVVFSREGGGHVGFYVGEDNEYYHILGGNQKDKVCIVRIQKSRATGFRRPNYNNQPASVKAYKLAATGIITTNEA